MIPGRLHVVARLVAKREKLAEVTALLSGLVAPTRAEAGCLRYELMQDQSDPTDFTFVEEWTDEEALEAHLLTAHVGRAMAQAPILLAASPDIRRYRQIA